MTEPVTSSVLVVEDDDAIRESIVMLLEYSGFSVRSASNGKEALERIAEGLPDLILLDMKMPVMNGWEFALRLRESHPRPPAIIVLTAAEDARKRAEEIRACCGIGKPFDVDELLSTLRAHLGGNPHG